MKLRSVFWAALAAALVLGGCATKPPPETPPVEVPEPTPEPKPEPVPEPAKPVISTEELTAAHDTALAARKDAFDQGAKDLFPDDWAVADARYTEGKTALDKDDREKAKAELEAALPLFKALADRAALANAEAAAKTTLATRERALAAGAVERSPEALAAAEAFQAKAEAAYADKDPRGAVVQYKLAMAAYDATEKRSRALAIKDKVDGKNFGSSDPGNYAIAAEKLAQADESLGKEPAIANDAAAEALLRYNLVWKKGWELAAGAKKEEAGSVKAKAQGIKAQVAVKAEFQTAQASYEAALKAYDAGEHEASEPLFIEAAEQFAKAYALAADKRAAAEAALKAAGDKTKAAADKATEADKTLLEGEEPADAGTNG